MADTAFIAVDWGSSSFRAWAMTPDGTPRDSRSGPDGLKTVADRDFAGVIRRHCGDWLDAMPGLPVIMQGMVGARTGWIEAAYAPCPVRVDQLTEAATRLDIDGHPAAILPGATVTECGEADVMRGEEVQVFGAAALTGLSDATICIPGTHCKWARLEGGALTGFQTYISGELYQLLLRQSLVGALADGEAMDPAAFRRGLDRGTSQPLAHAVFAGRASTLTGGLLPAQVAPFLSGVLIGAEIAARPETADILLMASGVQAELYAQALDHLGRGYRTVDAEAATMAGLSRAARKLWPQAVPA